MIDAIAKGITIGLLLSISVGPVLFSVIKQSLNNGHKGGLAFAFGVSASDITLVLLANVFTGLFLRLRFYEKPIGIAGSILLIAIGVYFLFFKKIKVNEDGKIVFKHRARDLLKISLSGYFMNLMNPGMILLWITISGSLIGFSTRHKIIIYVTALAIVLLADLFKVFLAGRIRNKLTPHNIHILNRVNGIILIIFGLVLIGGLFFYVSS
ncbi:MAG: LysE family transporter [Sphingobacteriales bacterium]|nr:LysE family transporter [Sphingobacteriales bacterium]